MHEGVVSSIKGLSCRDLGHGCLEVVLVDESNLDIHLLMHSVVRVSIWPGYGLRRFYRKSQFRYINQLYFTPHLRTTPARKVILEIPIFPRRSDRRICFRL